MKKHLGICFFLLITIQYSNAQWYDNQWVFGYSSGEEHGFGISLLDFNDGDVDVSYYGASMGYRLGFTGSVINDKEGVFYLSTNHCQIKNKEWQTISGDSLLTTTGTAATTCIDGGDSYGALQSSLLLPDLVYDSLTYLIHKDFIIDFDNQDLYSNDLWFSTIEKRNDNLIYKKKYLINSKSLIVENLTACPNKEKSKWWVIIPQHESNIFEKYLIGLDSVTSVSNQAIGFPYKILEMGIGQAQYSPDGSMFAINTGGHGVLLYDFDNETGELSNFRNIPYPDSENVAQGLCFSSDARFIYTTTAENVYQIDLDNDNEVVHIGQYASIDESGWPVGLGMMFMGPDCKIYVSPGSGTFYLHVIKEPNRKGLSCDFAERIIQLPTRVPHHLPNIPQYRYLTGCDSSITFPFVSDISEVERLNAGYQIFPNPTVDLINISVDAPLKKIKSLILYSELGKKVKVLKLQKGENSFEFDISSLPHGFYYLRDIDNDIAFKIVKME